jgi:hypothetical protein
MRFINWLLSKLFPYKMPDKLSTMLVCQRTLTDHIRTGMYD